VPQQNWYTKNTMDNAATMNATIKYADSILESLRYLTTTILKIHETIANITNTNRNCPRYCDEIYI
jgi:hypothetical protein